MQLGCGLSIAGGARAWSPAVLFAGGQDGAWYDPGDLSTLWQDTAGTTPITAAGQTVRRMDDKSGNGRPLLQPSAGEAMVLRRSGAGWYLEGSGITWMQADFTFAQPFDRVSAVQVDIWQDADRIFDGGFGISAGILWLRPSSPQVQIYSGTEGPAGAVSLGQPAVITERHAGASSRLAVDDNAYATGNAGTAAPNGLTLFARHSGTFPTSGRFYGLVQRVPMTDPEISQLRAWLRPKAAA